MGLGAAGAAAAIGAAGSIGGALISSSGAGSAGSGQTDAANQAAALQQQQFNQTQANLAPFVSAGTNATNQLTNNYLPSNSNYIGAIESNIPWQTVQDTPQPTLQNNSVMPGNMTQDQLEQTPGYQFALAQGLKSTQSAAAARGLGVSGAALKGAASYSTGLANQTYKDQFNIAQQQFADQLNKDQQNFGQQNSIFQNQLNLGQTLFNQNQARVQDYQNLANYDQNYRTSQYNQLLSNAQLGENAAAMTGSMGQQAANASGGYLTSGANAAGASQIASGNALTSGLNGLGNSASQGLLLNKLFGSSYDTAGTGPFDGAGYG